VSNLLKDKKLLTILFLSLFFRILFFLIYSPWKEEVEKTLVLNGDAVQYHYLGIALLKTAGFADNVFRTPIYPGFIAFIYAIFGVHPYIVLLFQIFLSVLSVYLVFKIGEISFNRKVGLVAAVIMAMDPHQITFASWLFSDTFFAFLFILTVYYFIKGILQNNFRCIIISAVILGINILTKPVVQFFPMALILLCLIWIKVDLKSRLKYSIVYLLIPFFIALPWLLRNQIKYQHFAISSIVGFDKLVYSVPLTEHSLTHKSNGAIIDSFLTKIKTENPSLKNLPENSAKIWNNLTFETTDVYGKYADAYLKEHRTAYLKLHFIGMVKLMLNMGTQNMLDKLHVKNKKWSDEERYTTGVFQLAKKFVLTKSPAEVILGLFIVLFLILCYLYGFIGVFYTLKNKEYLLLFLFGGAVLYFLLIYGKLPIVRFKLPITAMYSILSGYGFYCVHLISKQKKTT